MFKDNILHYSVRLNMENDKHVKINKVIQNLNPQIYKSKNKFIVEALDYYIEHFGNEEFVAIDKNEEKKFVTKKELEQIKSEINASAIAEAKNEIIRLLGKIVCEKYYTEKLIKDNEKLDK